MITREVNNLDELFKAIEEIGDNKGVIKILKPITLESRQVIRLPINITLEAEEFRMEIR